MDIKRLYKPIFKNDKITRNMVLIIIPIKLSYIATLALLVASKKVAK